MLAMELAKLPPPKPARAATTSMIPNGVSGLPTTTPSRIEGMSRSAAEIIVQLRPPNLATMNVYGKRIVAPTRLGTEISQNASELVNANPASGSITTTMLHSCQTMKPRNSAKIDQPRFRRATERPSDCQKSESSGSQPSIQLPGLRVRVVEPVAATSAPAGGVTVVVIASPSGRYV